MSTFTFKTGYGGGVSSGVSPKQWGYAVTEAASNAIYDFMVDVAEEASELAPVKTGRLRSSAVIGNYGDGGYKVTFNAYNPENGYNYAAIQHENLSYVHRNGGQARYLADAYDNLKGNLISHMAENCIKASKGGRVGKKQAPESFGNTQVIDNTTPTGNSGKRGRRR